MKQYGLLGKKLDYSFSKSFFTAYFEKHQIPARYENIEVSNLEQWVAEKGFADFLGFNVTIPYKEAIIPFLHDISDEAKAIGAVNTVKNENGKLIGYNTDAFGFGQSIKPFLNNLHEKAIILGTGGASKAVAHVLERIGLSVIYISRDPQNASEFAYSDVNEYMLKACKMIVNCTPLGTFPNVAEIPDIPVEFITNEHLVVDLIYNPEKTALLIAAEKKGAIIVNGASMLREQALKAWEIFTEV